MSVSAPPAVTFSPSPMKALALASSTLTANAPATLTLPSEVEASGFVAPSVPLALDFVPFVSVSAKDFWSSLFFVTFWSLLPSSASPPATLAFALLWLPEMAVASKSTPPAPVFSAR